MQASKIEIENSVIRILENGPLLVTRKLEADAKKYTEFTAQLVEDIHDEGFSRHALEIGMKLLRKQWTMQRWPVTGELLAFLRQGNAYAEPQIENKSSDDAPDPEKWARQMMRSETGRKALHQGWHYELWMWGKDNPGKTPQDDDVHNMREAEGIGRRRIGQVRADWREMFCGESLLSIAEGMDRKKTELLEEFRT